MPACFMVRNSRSNSGLMTAGPNHHQRIMILQSGGGSSKPARIVVVVSACAKAGRESMPTTSSDDAMHRNKQTAQFSLLAVKDTQVQRFRKQDLLCEMTFRSAQRTQIEGR